MDSSETTYLLSSLLSMFTALIVSLDPEPVSEGLANLPCSERSSLFLSPSGDASSGACSMTSDRAIRQPLILPVDKSVIKAEMISTHLGRFRLSVIVALFVSHMPGLYLSSRSNQRHKPQVAHRTLLVYRSVHVLPYQHLPSLYSPWVRMGLTLTISNPSSLSAGVGLTCWSSLMADAEEGRSARRRKGEVSGEESGSLTCMISLRFDKID